MSLASIGFHLGEDVQFRCYTYTDAAPILDMSICGAVVTITPAGRDLITDDVMATVREFTTQVQRFLSECERIRALQLDQADQTVA
ncbi:hypothetical protein [Nonomuraea lactucae]|uniref:hypothetical protein n=1 Tax=Nonomuraea lactucae TaxID=2249762 RepID=UPI000DE3668F|nr:hypothetical protein [Nonomuraea lactucae]